MNAVKIEGALLALALQRFSAAEVPGGVRLRNDAHIAVCEAGAVARKGRDA